MIDGCLGHTEHKAIELDISIDRKKNAIKTSTLDIRRAELRLVRELVSEVSWENAFEDARVHKF